MKLSTKEISELTYYENRAEEGMLSFGLAIKEIRDRKLYREEHETFESYCEKRWNISRSRAYQQIEAAEVKSKMSTNCGHLVTNEGQARALSGVPAQERESVLAAAAESGAVTAASIEEAADYWHASLPEEAMLAKIASLWERFDNPVGSEQRRAIDGVNLPREIGLHLQGISGHRRMSHGKYLKFKDRLPAALDWENAQECVRLALKFTERVKLFHEAHSEADAVAKLRGLLKEEKRKDEQFASDVTPPTAAFHAAMAYRDRIDKASGDHAKWDDLTRQSFLDELERLVQYLAGKAKIIVGE